MGQLITLFWTSCESPWGFKTRLGNLIGRGVHVTCFTSGVIPADLLVALMAAELFSFTYLQASIDGAQNGIYRATTASQCETRQTFYGLSYAGSAVVSDFARLNFGF